jgi:septation ring formation regulator EzrA
LQSLIDIQQQAEAAQEALQDYRHETFGILGEDIMDSIVTSIQDKGVDAWEAFGDAGAKVIENLGRQFAYELFFADKFAKLQDDLSAVYDKTNNPEDIARQQMELVGKFYAGIENDMDAAQAFMENWQKKASEYGFDLWQDGAEQSGKAGAFSTMTQEQGTKLEGLFTSVQMHMANIDNQLNDIGTTMYAASDTLIRIEENTAYCRRLDDIATDIAVIKRDGLKMK